MFFDKVNLVVFLAAALSKSTASPANIVSSRNSDVAILPGWSSVGCFVDNGGFKTPATPNGLNNRTLMAQSLFDATGMTPTKCMQFCSSFQFPYGFAGVEQGTECWCDGVIQLPGTQAADADCSTPCAGDPTLSCGGTQRISVFTNGTPSPKIPTVAYEHVPGEAAAFVPFWEYMGCFSDSPTNRLLSNLQPSVTGLDANTCVVACQNAFPFSVNVNPSTLLYAGLEAGNQCWCGTSLPTSAAAHKLPDIACESMGCLGVNDQACGGPSAMALYQVNPLQLQDCFSLQLSFLQPFQLNIAFLDGEPTVPVTMTSIITHNNPVFNLTTRDAGILSYCPTCPNPVIFELDTDSQWELRVVNFSNPAINNDLNSVVNPGGTINFVQITDDDPVFVGYCSTNSPLHSNVAQLTAFAAHEIPPITQNFNPKNFISFSLCSNMTAGGRLDVVYRPLTFMTGYNLTNCKDVILEMDYNVTVPAGAGFL